MTATGASPAMITAQTLAAIDALAAMLREQKDFEHAQHYQELAWHGFLRLVGATNRDTLTAGSDLALILLARRDLHGARSLGEEVLECGGARSVPNTWTR